MSKNNRKNKNLPNFHNNSRMMVSKQEFFNGPLPPPKVLEHYNEIIPGAAERIIKMAEEQSEHRRGLEKEVITSGIKNSKLGLWFGLIIGIVGLGCATIITLYGEQLVGGIVGIGTLGSLVGTFVYGSQQKKQEREQSRENIQSRN
jgi:uncharacterized membrane protein